MSAEEANHFATSTKIQDILSHPRPEVVSVAISISIRS